ncbi:expressed protein [Phakopsora pachyrhizi]|uniref:Expressed protein n=1 Tax=Phakopsora pachyrhizi TaxID=170000 RepID=A0AAV0AF82_PHAPC|nr:expressed protein [Phakopsora pachyrhizi]
MSSIFSNIFLNSKSKVIHSTGLNSTNDRSTVASSSSPSSSSKLNQSQNHPHCPHHKSLKPITTGSSSSFSPLSLVSTIQSSPSPPLSSISSHSYSSSSSSSSPSSSSPPSLKIQHKHLRLIDLKKPILHQNLNTSNLRRQQLNRRQVAKDDEAIYGPPSPGQLADPASSTENKKLQSNSSSNQISPSTDELFLSEHYPPIQIRTHPFFNEKLTSPIGMGRGQPIIPQSGRNLTNSHFSLLTTWRRIARIFTGPPYYLPELPESLSYPADQISISSLQRTLSIHGLNLPNAVRDHFLVHDGQDVFSHSASGLAGAGSTGIVWGLWLMSCEEVETEWGFWRRLDNGLMPDDAFTATDFSLRNVTRRGIQENQSRLSSHQQEDDNSFDPRMSSCPSGWVREVYSHPGWLPLLSDRAGNYIGVDLNPPELETTSPLSAHSRPVRGGGQGHALPEAGQVIAFGREIDEKVVLWQGEGRDGWANWLASLADDLEDGSFAGLSGRPARKSGRSRRDSECEMGWGTDGKIDQDGDEDGLGDLGYFNDGTGCGNGADEFYGWRLASEYRGMSVIEALCARSKNRWAEIGLYSSRLRRSESIDSLNSYPSGPSQPISKLNLVSRPERHDSLLPQSSGQPESEKNTTDSPRSANETFSSTTPIAYVTPPSPRLNAEPAQLKASSPSTQPEPRLIPAMRQDRHHPKRHQTDRSRRPPPPAPMLLDLPTLDNLMVQTDLNDSEKDEDSNSCPVSDSPQPTGFVNRLSMATRRLSEEMGRMANGSGMGAGSSSNSSSSQNRDVIGMGKLTNSSMGLKISIGDVTRRHDTENGEQLSVREIQKTISLDRADKFATAV